MVRVQWTFDSYAAGVVLYALRKTAQEFETEMPEIDDAETRKGNENFAQTLRAVVNNLNRALELSADTVNRIEKASFSRPRGA